MTTKEAFKALCSQRGALTNAIKLTECRHPGKRSAEIRWRIKHKKMWPQEAIMFRYLTLAGWTCENGQWRKN